MRRWMKGRPKEQLVLLAVLVLLGPITVWGMAGTEAPEDPPRVRAPREPNVGAATAVEFPHPDFAGYWGSDQSLWSVEQGARLPLYGLPIPPVPAPNLSAPPLSPSPPLELVFGAGAAETFVLGQTPPSLAAEWLLPQEQYDALAAREIPDPPGRPDRRGERKYEWDIVIFESGEQREGEILEITDDGTVILQSGGSRMPIPKSKIKELRRRFTNLQRYEIEHERLKNPPLTRDWEAREALAGQTLAWGMVPQTIALLEEAHALVPHNDTLTLQLVDLYEEVGRYDSAVGVLNEAIRRTRTGQGRFGLRLGRVLETIGLREAALTAYRAGASLSAEARLGQAWMELRLGGFARARATAKLLTSSTRVPAAEVHTLLALIALSEPPRAGESLTDRLAAVKGSTDAAVAAVQSGRDTGLRPRVRAMLNTLVGVSLTLQGKPSAAALFASALEVDQNLTEAWLNLAWIYALAGKPVEARALLVKALERDPASAEAWIGTAITHWLEQDAAGTETALTRALEVDPNHYYPFYLRAMTAADADAAAPLFAEVLRREFDYGGAYLAAGLNALALNRLLEAETLLRRAAAQSRGAGPSLVLVGLLIRQGLSDEARELLEGIQAGGPADEPAKLYARGHLEYNAMESGDENRLKQLKDAYFAPAASAGYAPAQQALALIDEWLATKVVLEDTFDGEDGAEIMGGRWSARLQPGVTATFLKGRARIGGLQQETGSSQIEADFDGEDFWRLEATVWTGDLEFFVAGVSLYHTRVDATNWRGVHAALHRMGTRYVFRTASAASTQVIAGTLLGKDAASVPVPKERFTVRFERAGTRGGAKIRILVRVDDEVNWSLLEEGLPIGRGGQRFRVALFGGALPEETFEFSVDDVRVYTRSTQ